MELQTCLQCHKVIPVGKMTAYEYRKRKFCGSSCAATYNNRKKEHKTKYCKCCGKQIPLQNTFCSLECMHEDAHRAYIDKWKAGEVDGTVGSAWKDISDHVRKYIFKKYQYKCARCGWSEVNLYTGTIPLEIDHIDGDAKNNTEDNLILLCPNCHSLTSTYRGANKGHGTRDIHWTLRA